MVVLRSSHVRNGSVAFSHGVVREKGGSCAGAACLSDVAGEATSLFPCSFFLIAWDMFRMSENVFDVPALLFL